jgi:DNA-binding MarR family transcriptional regulator
MRARENMTTNRDELDTMTGDYFSQTETTEPREADIRDLFSYQLQRLAGLSTRIAALSIRPKYGITPRDWRVIAVLKYLGQAPLQDLAKHSGVLKSQMSRTVASLIDRGYIAKGANPEDGRSILLRLSPEGLDLSRQILEDSLRRNEEMMATLSRAEQQILVELLRRVTRTSAKYFHDLKSSASQSDLKSIEEE